MEEKKYVKISLGTAICLAVIFIFIICGLIFGVYYYNLNNEKENESLSGVDNNVNESNKDNTFVDEEDRELGTTNEIDNTNSNITTEIIDNEENKFSSVEIEKALTDYLNIFKGYGSIEGILEKLELLEFGEYSNSELTDDNYRKTDVKYQVFEDTVKNYMTEECFNTFNSNDIAKFKQENGLLYYNDVGLTGTEYVVESITLKGDYSDLSYIANVYSINLDDSKDYENIEFHISDYNGKCVISYCD